jgi:hypothetical protein
MRRLLVATTALATLLAGGCGIPDDSDVTVVGPGPSQGTSVGEDGSAQVQYTRQDTDDYVTLVQYYLQAAAGDPETATARVKAFLSPDAAAEFEGGTDPTVVRLTEAPLFTPGQSEVTLRGVQPVGMLNANGLVEPAPEPVAASPLKFEVGPVAGQDGLFITKAPQLMLLSDVALDNFYQPRTIYFWNRDFTRLVPDLRYMPTSVIPVQQPTTVLGWLAAGPAPWLLPAVQPLPPGTAAPDNVPAISNDTLQITLSAQAVKQGDSVQMDRLRRQLQWSLLPLAPRHLEIKIGHQDPVRFTDEPYQESNPAFGLADIPERFAIYHGVIHRLNGSPREGEPVPVLKPAANKGIATAAISSTGSHSFAAVVTGTGSNQTLRMGVAPADQQADLRPVRGLTGTLGRPVWAVTSAGDRAGAVGLVTRNGQLYSFAADGSPAQPVTWPGSPGSVTSVSVAPDGQRVALVSGGRLYRAVLSTAGDITLSPPQRIRPSNFATVAAVAWSSETLLAVAGVRNDRYAVIDASLDGALSTTRLPDIGTEPVTDLTAYPANPKANREAGSIFEAYVADNAGWDVLSSFRQITAGQLVDPVPNAPPGSTPTAPFFLD